MMIETFDITIHVTQFMTKYNPASCIIKKKTSERDTRPGVLLTTKSTNIRQSIIIFIYEFLSVPGGVLCFR